jgi:hypothetical protein
VLGIPGANDANDALATDDFAVLTDRFYAASDLHGSPLEPATEVPDGAAVPFIAELDILTTFI